MQWWLQVLHQVLILKEPIIHLPIGQVFNTISSYAFSGSAPNQLDPLFIHLRIKSNNQDIYKEISNSLSSNFNNLLSQMNPEYADESHGENITKEPLLNFQEKGTYHL